MPFLRPSTLRVTTLALTLATTLTTVATATPAHARAGTAVLPTEAPAPTPIALSVVTEGLDPARWCRPVVSAVVDPEPLACWLAMTSTEPTPTTLTGMDFGDLPPWGGIDVDAIGQALDDYQQQLEARAAAEAAAAAAARNTRPAAPRAPAPTPAPSSALPPGMTIEELDELCWQGNQAACDAVMDGDYQTAPSAPAPAPAPAPEEDTTDYTIDYRDHSEADAWWDAAYDDARRMVDEQCPNGGMSIVNYSSRDGLEISVYCDD